MKDIEKLINTKNSPLGISILYYVSIVFGYIALFQNGMNSMNYYSDFLNDHRAIFLLNFPMILFMLTLCIWLLLVWETMLSNCVVIIMSLCFICSYVSLIIVDIYSLFYYNITDWTDDIVDKRVDLEIEKQCCIPREIFIDSQNNKISQIHIYSDCPYVTEQKLAIDYSSCKSIGKTASCEVSTNDFYSGFICSEPLKENKTWLIILIMIEIVSIISLLYLLFDQFQKFKKNYSKHSIKSISLKTCCIEKDQTNEIILEDEIDNAEEPNLMIAVSE